LNIKYIKNLLEKFFNEIITNRESVFKLVMEVKLNSSKNWFEFFYECHMLSIGFKLINNKQRYFSYYYEQYIEKLLDYYIENKPNIKNSWSYITKIKEDISLFLNKEFYYYKENLKDIKEEVQVDNKEQMKGSIIEENIITENTQHINNSISFVTDYSYIIKQNEELNEVISNLKSTKKDISILIHVSDSIRNSMNLSVNRGESIKQYLQENGISNNISIVPLGSTRPLYEYEELIKKSKDSMNFTYKERKQFKKELRNVRSKNERVEIIINN
jgi:outer membrane protein OmpA-like peptidoglycan-associated protein